MQHIVGLKVSRNRLLMVAAPMSDYVVVLILPVSDIETDETDVLRRMPLSILEVL